VKMFKSTTDIRRLLFHVFHQHCLVQSLMIQRISRNKIDMFAYLSYFSLDDESLFV